MSVGQEESDMTHEQRYSWWLHGWQHYNRLLWAIEAGEAGIAACAAIRLVRAVRVDAG